MSEASPSRLASLFQAREFAVAAFVLLVFIGCAIYQPRFLAADSLRSILLYIPLIIVVAMGQMMVIISRNIDLSVGSMLGLSAIVVGNVYIDHPATPTLVAGLIAAAVGGSLGLVNGILVALLRLPAIIATLGTLTAYRGLIFIYSHGKQVDNDQLPTALIRLSQTSPIPGVPWIVIFAAIIAILAALWLRYARMGRYVFAIGSNPAAAQLRGVPVRSVLLTIFTLTGVLSGIAGLLFASRFGYVNPVSTGSQFELVVISAVVIGGTNVYGGAGSVLGVVLGCLLLGIVNVALPMLGVSAFWQLALYGLAILLAATLDTVLQRRSRRAEVLA
jgi:rhamnose transport system permease protein